MAEVKPIPPPLPDNVIEPIVPVKPAGKPQPVVAEVKPVVSVPRPVSPAPAPTATNNAAGANRLPMGNIGDPNAELETAVARSLANLTPSATVPEPPAEIWSGETKVATIAPDYRGLRYSYLKPRAPSAGFRHKARPYFDEGRRLQRLNRMEDAVNNYRRAIDWDGGYFEAYHNLGLAATRKQDFLLAATAYETALALRPNSTIRATTSRCCCLPRASISTRRWNWSCCCNRRTMTHGRTCCWPRPMTSTCGKRTRPGSIMPGCWSSPRRILKARPSAIGCVPIERSGDFLTFVCVGCG